MRKQRFVNLLRVLAGFQQTGFQQAFDDLFQEVWVALGADGDFVQHVVGQIAQVWVGLCDHLCVEIHRAEQDHTAEIMPLRLVLEELGARSADHQHGEGVFFVCQEDRKELQTFTVAPLQVVEE